MEDLSLLLVAVAEVISGLLAGSTALPVGAEDVVTTVPVADLGAALCEIVSNFA